ncbi:MAG: ABC transporter substrate-binding protein [Actinomycetota bacterium]
MAVSVLVVVLAGCGLLPERGRSRPRVRGQVTVGLADLVPLDPARATSDGAMTLLATACQGLLSLDPQHGTPRADLADRWDLAQGARRMTLRLREGIRFSDGRPVDADAVVESLTRVARPEAASPWAHLLQPVAGFAELQAGASPRLEGVRATGPRTVEIELTQPLSDLPAILAHPALVPVSVSASIRDPEGFNRRPVCSGPYRFRAAPGEQDALLEWWPGGVDGSSPAPARIAVRGFDSVDEAYEAFERGEVDVAALPEGRAGGGLPQGVGVLRRGTLEVTYLAFDTAKPPVNDPRLRRAVSLAINRLAIVDAAFGDRREPALRWLAGPGGTSGCATSAEIVAEPERAKQALGDIATTGVRLPLVVPASGVGRLVAQALQVQIEEVLGLDVAAQVVDDPALQASLADRAAAGWLLTAGPDIPVPGRLLSSVAGTGGPANPLGFSDAELDRLLARAQASGEPQERERLLEQAEAAACELMPAVPLWKSVRHYAYRPGKIRIEGEPAQDVFGRLLLRLAHPR